MGSSKKQKQPQPDTIAELDAMIDQEEEEDENLKTHLMVPTGSTLYNLACTDRPDGAFPVGTIVNVVGDSSSGKTVLGLSCFGECNLLPSFDDYRFIYDYSECAAEIDIGAMFGKRTASRIEKPHEGKTLTGYSSTVEDWQDAMNACLEDGRPFIYLLDSLDALTSENELAQVEKQKISRETGEATTGDYTAAKKAASITQILRTMNDELKGNNSLLIVISQVRKKLDSRFPVRYRTGGDALLFYTSLESWVQIRGKLEVRGRQVGVHTVTRVSKNKITGKRREVPIVMRDALGIDDAEALLTFLIDEKVFEVGKKKNTKKKDKEKDKEKEKEKKKSNSITIEELGFEGLPSTFLKRTEDPEVMKWLVDKTTQTWKEIEASLVVTRFRKYA